MTAASFRRVHAAMTVVWAVLLVPSVVWWKHSLVWIVLMSCYANFAGHFAAYQGSRSEDES